MDCEDRFVEEYLFLLNEVSLLGFAKGNLLLLNKVALLHWLGFSEKKSVLLQRDEDLIVKI